MGPNWEDIDAFLSVNESTQIPATGAELELALGYDGELARVGGCVVDEIEISGWPGELMVRARAAAQAEYDRRARRRATLSLSNCRRPAVRRSAGCHRPGRAGARPPNVAGPRHAGARLSAWLRRIRAGGAIPLCVNEGPLKQQQYRALSLTSIPDIFNAVQSHDRTAARRRCPLIASGASPAGRKDRWEQPTNGELNCAVRHTVGPAQDAALRPGWAQCPHAANRHGACACRTSHPRQLVSCTRRQKGLEKPESRSSLIWLGGRGGSSSAISCGRWCSA